MKKLIIKSNEWYDNLPEPKRTIFFFAAIMAPFLITNVITTTTKHWWAFPVCVVVFMVWRLGYVLIQIIDKK